MTETPLNPFAAMTQQMQDMAKALNPTLEGFDSKNFEKFLPTIPKEAMEFWFGNTLNRDGLDAKTRLFLTLAGLVFHGAQAETPLRQTVRHLVAAEASKQEILEAIGQMTVFVGVPAVTRALALAQEVLVDAEGTTE
ncbi:MAG: carboxymuconolactone decarboxylase family protein [Aestuariivita sp.]|nr:carboxymuconolactone decarboxylase family protein [Aestuariivita sp.]MCY4202712.1 carboxymuconolactone decarboxylase family protein [Aestuariivita sp.]MCY4289361.1 carboxymuconolactone decarboxylase family protein [Aestuariivita sp.]MCY4347756.1 carboxymuconolactone decarboxylase family protein [Aestuariivita sp.]